MAVLLGKSQVQYILKEQHIEWQAYTVNIFNFLTIVFKSYLFIFYGIMWLFAHNIYTKIEPKYIDIQNGGFEKLETFKTGLWQQA